MSRSRRHEEKDERIVVMSDGEIPDAELPDVGSEPQVVADATRRNPPPPKVVARVQHYQVVRGGYFLDASGTRALMREGKVIDTLNYDVQRLTSQGIRLQEVDPNALADL